MSKQNEIIKCMYGKWKFSESVPYIDNERNITSEVTMSYTLDIDVDNINLRVKRNDEIIINDVERTDSAHWVDDNIYLHFIDGHKYFIEDANETNLKFGILQNKGVFNGNYQFIIFEKVLN